MTFMISVVSSYLADRLATAPPSCMQTVQRICEVHLKSQSGEAWGVPFEQRWGALACWTLQGAARQTPLALKAAHPAAALAKPLQMQMQALALHLLLCSLLDLMKHSFM